MATEIRSFDCLIPAGTLDSAPVTVDISFPPRVVDVVEIIVPPGPSGLVGFYLANSNVRVIPYDSADWIITSAEKISWPLQQYIDSGSWQLVGYNTGVQDHTVYVRFLLDLPPQPSTSGSTAPLDILSTDTVPAAATDTDVDATTELDVIGSIS